jgi:predicted Zn-dependent peptidase
MTAQLVIDQPPGSTRTILSGDTEDVLGTVQRTVLPGGLRVISEHMPGVRSVSVGVWVDVGSRDETPTLAGATHFLEHLLFKGTTRRSAEEISGAIEAVGGDLNAVTTKEYTCYYAHVLDRDLPLAVDVLGDMLTGSLLTEDLVAGERTVVLEEIAMREDEPSEVVHELIATALWGETPLGRPIAGTRDSVQELRRDQLRRWLRSRYDAPRIVVAAAGNVAHEELVRLVRVAFGAARTPDGAVPVAPRPARVGRGPRSRRGRALVTRPTEQANLVLGLPALPRTDPRRWVLAVLNSVLGSGMSSRLFVEVRERRGLAYSVYSYLHQYSDAGMLGLYAGCAPAKAGEVLAVLDDELHRLLTAGPSEAELARGKGHLRGATVLALEDTGSRMSRLGKAELLDGELPTLGEVLQRIDAVTADDVASLAADLRRAPRSVAVVGPFDNLDVLLR